MFKFQPCHYYEIFSQFSAHYGRSKLKEIKCPKIYFLNFHIVILKYICISKHTKKLKYIQEIF
jgi:hypothetical protein